MTCVRMVVPASTWLVHSTVSVLMVLMEKHVKMVSPQNNLGLQGFFCVLMGRFWLNSQWNLGDSQFKKNPNLHFFIFFF